MKGRFVRLGEKDRAEVTFYVDGAEIVAKEGDSVMVAILIAGRHLRTSEFSDHKRAGFCLMGACQDCWIWTEEGDRLRSCSTVVSEGLKILTANEEVKWAGIE